MIVAALVLASLLGGQALAETASPDPVVQAQPAPTETDAAEASTTETDIAGEEDEPLEPEPSAPEAHSFGPPPAAPLPGAPTPEEPGVEEPLGFDEAPTFPCDRLEYLWNGPYAGQPGAEDDPDRPASLEDAARVYTAYFRYLFLSQEYALPCEVPHDPLISTANACAAIARGRGTASELAGLLAREPDAATAIWMLDAVIRHDREYAVVWRNYFGPGPAFRVIDLMFDGLPRGGVVNYEGLLRLTESAQGVYANYIASRFIALFANQPQWVLINAERFIPFGPALRIIFCNYLSIPEREALVVRYSEFPYSDAQAAIIELVACM